MDCSLPGSSIHGVLQARILEWVAVSSSRGPSPPRDRTGISRVSGIGRWILYHLHHLGSSWIQSRTLFFLSLSLSSFLSTSFFPLTTWFLICLFFNWRETALQYCVGFYSTITKSAIITHISPPSWAFPHTHPARSSQSLRLGSLGYRATSQQPSVLHTVV